LRIRGQYACFRSVYSFAKSVSKPRSKSNQVWHFQHPSKNIHPARLSDGPSKDVFPKAYVNTHFQVINLVFTAAQFDAYWHRAALINITVSGSA
jgi:hypothetical protein